MASLNGFSSRRKQNQRREVNKMNEEQSVNLHQQENPRPQSARRSSRRISTEPPSLSMTSRPLSGRIRPSSSGPTSGRPERSNPPPGPTGLFPPIPASRDGPQDPGLDGMNSQPPGGSGRSDVDEASTSLLLDTLSSRMQHLETTVRQLRTELVLKERSMLDANRHIKECDAELSQVVEENRRLRLQIHEMEAFLADYGLVWIGGEGSPPHRKDASAEVNTANHPINESLQLKDQPTEAFPKHAVNATAVPQGEHAVEVKVAVESFVPDFDILFTRIRELNVLMEADKAKVVKNESGTKATLEFQQGISLVIYGDGISVKEGPFRPYSDSKTEAFIKDLLDGYFPYEFKEEYPDGVVIHPSDKRHQNRGNFLPFSGKGNLLLHSPDYRVVNIQNQSSGADSAKPRLSSYGPSEFQLVPTPALKDLQAACTQHSQNEELQSGRRPSAREISENITTLQIKFDNGLQPILIKMKFEDTLGQLHREIDNYLMTSNQDDQQEGDNSALCSYELRTPYPNKAHTDLSQSLQNANLIPNATLVVRWKGKKGINA